MNRFVSLPALAVMFTLVTFSAADAYAIESRTAAKAIVTTAQFAFYSDFATNLNDALLVAGDSRYRKEEKTGQQISTEDCFKQLPLSTKAGWDRAVDYYAEVISPFGWQARQQFLIRLDLMGLSDELDAGSSQFTNIAQNMRSAASPAYQACWWSKQNETNRTWIKKLALQLSNHEQAIASRLARIYVQSWHGLPLRVDVVTHAPPFGANSIHTSPVGGHILVASSVNEEDALEIVFHEASHTIMSLGRKDAFPTALDKTAHDLGVNMPGDLWHVVLFYLTGEVVKERLNLTGNPDYVPYIYAHNLWNGRWSGYQQAIESTLPRYMAGQISLELATRQLLSALDL